MGAANHWVDRDLRCMLYVGVVGAVHLSVLGSKSYLACVAYSVT